VIEGWNGWQPGDALLDGKAALIAGGGRGIGEATTRILAAAGAAVAVLDIVPERAEGVARSIESGGGTAIPVVADLRSEDDCRDAIDQAAAKLGRLDVLANVAGGMQQHAEWRPLADWTTEDWDRIVRLNLGYHFWLCRSVFPVMERGGGGSIVNVTSISGVFGSPNHSAYGAAKAGLIHLTKTLAVEGGRLGIRANAVSPGAIVTPATTENIPPERLAQSHERLSQITPLQRPGRPEDIARAVLFFASPIAEYVTGQMILVDGGVGSKFPFSAAGADPSQVSAPMPAN
jgi:NAD(P)-dependent dehydrogenase (short-subunit alcohol dehydrogenase family)